MHHLKNLRDDALLRHGKKLARLDHRTTAEILATIIEIEARRLHLTMGFDSMMAFCVKEWDLSEEAARRRVHAAHVVQNFPELHTAIADGRLHLSAVKMLAGYLTAANTHELICAASHRSRTELELELVRLFPQVEVLRLDDGVSPQVVMPQVAKAQPSVPGRPVSEPPLPKPAPARMTPITPERYDLDVTIDRETHDEIRELQSLLGHSGSQPSVAQVLKESVHQRLIEVKKRKFAEVERPRKSRGTTRPRGISAQVKRAVHMRDGDRCAYVGPTGHRCNSRKQLEYDHEIPVALGGKSTVENVRLVCHIHNQHAADQVFGKAFMDGKRRSSADDSSPVRLDIDVRLPDAIEVPLGNSHRTEAQDVGAEFGFDLRSDFPANGLPLTDLERVRQGNVNGRISPDDGLAQRQMPEGAAPE